MSKKKTKPAKPAKGAISQKPGTAPKPASAAPKPAPKPATPKIDPKSKVEVLDI